MVAPEADKTEKITVNVGLVDLGQIDLLVQEGFYANRTDFLRTAMRSQLRRPLGCARPDGGAQDTRARTSAWTRIELEKHLAAGTKVQIRVLGLATIAADVSPELAAATIDSVEVLGAFRASPAVKSALAGRTLGSRR